MLQKGNNYLILVILILLFYSRPSNETITKEKTKVCGNLNCNKVLFTTKVVKEFISNQKHFINLKEGDIIRVVAIKFSNRADLMEGVINDNNRGFFFASFVDDDPYHEFLFEITSSRKNKLVKVSHKEIPGKGMQGEVVIASVELDLQLQKAINPEGVPKVIKNGSNIDYDYLDDIKANKKVKKNVITTTVSSGSVKINRDRKSNEVTTVKPYFVESEDRKKVVIDENIVHKRVKRIDTKFVSTEDISISKKDVNEEDSIDQKIFESTTLKPNIIDIIPSSVIVNEVTTIKPSMDSIKTTTMASLYPFSDKMYQNVPTLKETIKEKSFLQLYVGYYLKMAIVTVKSFLPEEFSSIDNSGIILMILTPICVIIHLTNKIFFYDNEHREIFERKYLHDSLTKIKEQEVMIRKLQEKQINSETIEEYERLKKEYQKANIEQEQIKKINENLKTNNSNLMFDLKKKNDENVELIESIENKDGTINNLKESIELLEKKNNVLKSQNDYITNEVNNLKSELDDKDKEMKKCEQSYEDCVEKSELLKNQIFSLEKQLKDKKQECDKLQKEIEGLSEIIEEMNQFSQHHDNEKSGSPGWSDLDIDDSTLEKNKKIKKKSLNLSGKILDLARCKGEIRKLGRDIEAMTSKLNKETSEKKELLHKISILEDEVETQKKELSSNSIERNENLTQISRLLKLVEDRDNEIKNLYSRELQLQADYAELDRKNRNLHIEKAAMINTCKEAKTLIKSLQSDVNKIETANYNEVKKLKNQLKLLEENKNNEIQYLRLQNKTLQSRVALTSNFTAGGARPAFDGDEIIPLSLTTQFMATNSVRPLWSDADTSLVETQDVAIFPSLAVCPNLYFRNDLYGVPNVDPTLNHGNTFGSKYTDYMKENSFKNPELFLENTLHVNRLVRGLSPSIKGDQMQYFIELATADGHYSNVHFNNSLEMVKSYSPKFGNCFIFTSKEDVALQKSGYPFGMSLIVKAEVGDIAPVDEKYEYGDNKCSSQECITCSANALFPGIEEMKDKNKRIINNCECELPCLQNMYPFKSNFAQIHVRNLAKALNIDVSDENKINDTKNNYIILNLFIKNLAVMTKNEVKDGIVANIISDIGNNLSLLLGIGVFNIIEIIFCCIAFCFDRVKLCYKFRVMNYPT
uniref:SH3 domain-containing protein n=1 Tax=Parastrongyloides trichosuri TaxID=131310 RepID=A0A0N4Z5Q3_PARTI